jgi:hypothetical protein
MHQEERGEGWHETGNGKVVERDWRLETSSINPFKVQVML